MQDNICFLSHQLLLNLFINISFIRAKQLVDIFRKKVLQRGARGIIGLQRVFKNIDDDGSKSLSL